uniref:ABC transporter domain-containing protein n=1 Tax=Ciona savignyi TaxID=51511 RepID=H2YP07_CIOSA
CPAELYLSSGFTPLQALLDAGIMKVGAFISIIHIEEDLWNIVLSQMAKSGGIANADVFQLLSSFYLVMAFSPFLIFLLVYVVNEKEKKIKEGMKMMGLNNLALWLGWSLYTILVLVMTLIMAILAVLGRLFPKSNFFLIFLIFFLYGISLQMMSFMLTPFFSKAKTAGAVGSLLSLILSLFFLIVFFLPNMSTAVVCLLHLISPAGFAIGLNQIAVLELTSDGANFDSITTGQIPLYLTYVFLAVDIVVYFLLTLYFDSVIPSEYGQRKPLIYCLMPSFWCPPKKVPKVDDEFSTDVTAEREPVDADFIGKEAIVKIFHVQHTKRHQGDSTTAVQNFSLNIYEGQITAILGHNGAGKTTLFNILTGFVEATTGSARIYDYDVTNTFDMLKIRQMTGVCPQHNILNDELTVMQHLELYAGIKGIPDEKIKSEINRVINLVDLEDQVDTLSIKLSGGQKRKLSVGIAIIGDPKILILDEPTAGMDPYSRHKLWNVLRSRKAGRITLLTTHFMDEADILADRKIILSKGKLRCVGSSLFLKNKYGVGYHLGIVTKTSNKVEEITDCVKSHIADSELHRSAGFELSYTLPLSEVGRFAGLFADLESKGENLEIQSYGVSMTNLEEVFLRIGEEDESDDTSSQDEGMRINVEEGNRSAFNDLRSQVKLNRVSIILIAHMCSGKLKQRNIFQALLLKTFYVKIRSPAVIVFGLLLPMGLTHNQFRYHLLHMAKCFTRTQQVPIVTIDTLLLWQKKDLIESNLTNLLTPGFNPMASDIFSVDSLKVSIVFDLIMFPPMCHYTYITYHFSLFQLKYNALFNTTAVHSLPSIINFMSTSMLSMVSYGYITLVWSIATTLHSNTIIFLGVRMEFELQSWVLGVTVFFQPPKLGQLDISHTNSLQLKIRSQLRVSGAPFHIYWSSLFIIDYLWFLCVALAMIIGVLAFQVPFFVQPGAILALILLLIGWGVSCVLSSYCGSFIFKTSETAQAAWPNIVQLSGLLPYIIVALLDQLGSATAALYINVVLCLFIPFYVGFGGIYYISKVGISNIPTAVYFDWSQPMVPYTILIAYLQAFLLFTLLKSLDVVSAGGSIFDVFPFSLYKKHKTTVHAEENGSLLDTEDDDVRNEQSKISEIIKQGNFAEENLPVVITHNLNKTFVKKKSIINCKKKEPEVAVKSLSLSVYPGEVFGLLGPNGAGKTTAINTITADFAPTKGQIFVSGHSIQSNLSQVFQEMGYCPQDNPLWEEITLREHLEIYATAQGLSKQVVPAAAERCIKALGVEEHAHKRAKFLSGGTKRKVCFAIAMIGNPQVVLLDEPSTGMDPKTKRFMWNTISSAFEGSNRGAILTTHYMDEADALCSRVGIMVKGQLQCLGSTQHLKNKFGQGYSLELKVQQHVDTNNQDQIKVFVENLFGEGVTQTDHFAHRFVYKIPQEGMPSLSKIFSSLEQAKTELGIEEYSFSQSTLEQVFLQFARKQELEDTDC